MPGATASAQRLKVSSLRCYVDDDLAEIASLEAEVGRQRFALRSSGENDLTGHCSHIDASAWRLREEN